MNTIEIAALTEAGLPDLLAAVEAERDEAAWHRLAGFARDIPDGARSLYVAQQHGVFIGYVTIRWHSDYAGFRHSPIAPEIIDLYVWANARRQGVATELMDHAEQMIRDRAFKRAGLSVGVLSADQPAWHLYLQRGYRFDLKGAWWNGHSVDDLSAIDLSAAPLLVMMEKDL